MTPREIRQYATDNFGWVANGSPYKNITNVIALRLALQPSIVERALSRRDRSTPKSEGGPATEPVMIRINAQQKKKAQKLAKKAGCKTVSGWVKVLVEREVGE